MSRDSKRPDVSRRKFLAATGATALTSAVAGCGGGGGGGGTDSPGGGDGDGDGNGDGDGDGMGTPTDSMGDGGTETSTGMEKPWDFDGYPYGAGQTQVGQARQIMEEAGYGENDRFELSWLQYQSGTWEEMANTIRARLEQAHIDMSISQADFGALLNQTENGNMQAYTLGWIADYPAPQNFLQLVDPPNTVYDDPNITPNGARLFWDEEGQADPEVREYMTAQFDRIQNNPQNTEEARAIRQEAAVNVEEGIWASACMVPVYHRVDEVFWYDNVDYQPYGGMGGSRAKASNSVSSISGKNRLDVSGSTFNSLDPIASGNTASGDVIMDVFDAPMNYVNGTTEVEELIVEDYEVSDDLTTYTFTLKEGIQFQGDYGELTADDVVYSLRRLVESQNSTNTYFPISVMNIDREEMTVTITPDTPGGTPTTETRVVPGSTAVEAIDEYTFEVTLRNPFGYALSVLAYGAFSIVPEGIVGDIEGYEGDMAYSEFSSNPVGAGPFTLEKWESGNGGEVVLDRYDDYHGDGASFEGIDSATITDPTASFNYFLNQNADISGIPTEQYDPSLATVEETLDGGQGLGTYGPMRNDQTVNYAKIPTVNTFYIGFNMRQVPAAVRKAMAYVVNQPQFVESVFKSRGSGAFHLTPPSIYPGGGNAYNSHYEG